MNMVAFAFLLSIDMVLPQPNRPSFYLDSNEMPFRYSPQGIEIL